MSSLSTNLFVHISAEAFLLVSGRVQVPFNFAQKCRNPTNADGSEIAHNANTHVQSTMSSFIESKFN